MLGMVVNQHVFLIERIELFSSNLNYSTSRIALTSNQDTKITGLILPWSSGSGAWPSYFGPNKYWEHALSWWRLVFLLENALIVKYTNFCCRVSRDISGSAPHRTVRYSLPSYGSSFCKLLFFVTPSTIWSTAFSSSIDL